MSDCFDHAMDAMESEMDYWYGDGGEPGFYDYYKKPVVKRSCTKCECSFSSAYPKACPDCGGWTERK